MCARRNCTCCWGLWSERGGWSIRSPRFVVMHHHTCGLSSWGWFRTILCVLHQKALHESVKNDSLQMDVVGLWGVTQILSLLIWNTASEAFTHYWSGTQGVDTAMWVKWQSAVNGADCESCLLVKTRQDNKQLDGWLSFLASCSALKAWVVTCSVSIFL